MNPQEDDYEDAEDLELERSAEFWEMIEARRRQPTRPFSEIEKELRAREESAADSKGS
jgi:hypothetical protein